MALLVKEASGITSELKPRLIKRLVRKVKLLVKLCLSKNVRLKKRRWGVAGWKILENLSLVALLNIKLVNQEKK